MIKCRAVIDKLINVRGCNSTKISSKKKKNQSYTGQQRTQVNSFTSEFSFFIHDPNDEPTETSQQRAAAHLEAHMRSS